MENGAGQEGEEAAQQSLSPAERTAAVQALLPLSSRAASTKCLEALGGLDTEASHTSLE